MGKSRKRDRRDSSDSHKELLKRVMKLEKELERSKRRRVSPESYTSTARRQRSGTPPQHGHRSRSRLSHQSRVSSRSHRNRSPSGSNSQRSYSIDRVSNGSAIATTINDHYPGGMAIDKNNAEVEQLDVLNRISLDEPPPELIIHNDVELPDDVLHILGDDPGANKNSSFQLHQALCNRWSYILTNGLKKEESDELLARHVFPANCNAFAPPKINPEIIPVLSGPYVKRDACHSQFQDHLSSGVTALGKAINTILAQEENIPKPLKEKILPSLIDSGRILSNLFYKISQTRRSLITSALSKSVKDVVDKTSPGEFLFGAELGDKIKAAKTLERMGKELRPVGQQASASSNFLKKRGGANQRQPAAYQQLNRKRPVHPERELRPQKGVPSKVTRYQQQQRRRY